VGASGDRHTPFVCVCVREDRRRCGICAVCKTQRTHIVVKITANKLGKLN